MFQVGDLVHFMVKKIWISLYLEIQQRKEKTSSRKESLDKHTQLDIAGFFVG